MLSNHVSLVALWLDSDTWATRIKRMPACLRLDFDPILRLHNVTLVPLLSSALPLALSGQQPKEPRIPG